MAPPVVISSPRHAASPIVVLDTNKTSSSYGHLTITSADIALEKALHNLNSLHADYRTIPLEDAFNWNAIAASLDPDLSGRWYLVVFRSIRHPDADHGALYEADRLAHEEAKQSGGILKYWYGDLNHRRECLAMCVWANREFAKKATHKPSHIKAMTLAASMYDTYKLDRYWLVKEKGSREFRIEQVGHNVYETR
ncbi:hypothetical protein SpCBS45565_g02185 [Spizellomyces sp. 'palustris']|nr:hypothetical protein SpCBS45565_g02185 [Spizellomyces sp. 'palustris']